LIAPVPIRAVRGAVAALFLVSVVSLVVVDGDSPQTNAVRTVERPTTTVPTVPPRLRFTVGKDVGTSTVVHSVLAGGADEREEPATANPVRPDQVSPDGAMVVYHRTQGGSYHGCGFAGCSTTYGASGSILVANADGTGERELTTGGFDREPRWSPVANLIAFIRHIKDGEAQRDVVALMRSSGEIVGAIPNNTGSDFDPAFSPDGERIAYAHQIPSPTERTFELRVFDIHTGDDRVLMTGIDIGRPAWSPHGGTIAAIMKTSATSVMTDQVVSVSAAGGAQRVLFTAKPAGLRATQYVCGMTVNDFPAVAAPMWSPDGSLIAFAHNQAHLTQDAQMMDIATIKPDGSDLRTIRAQPPPRCGEPMLRNYDVIGLLGWF
jgi:Tol biopolymer transport system component